MPRVKYSDRFAQIRQISPKNRAVCYWRNNLSLADFTKENGWYVLEDSGSYNGLRVWMRIMVKNDSVPRLFQRKRKGIIEFWGSACHLGIMVRLKTGNFPKTHKGSEGWLRYEYRMEGTIDGLSYINGEKMEKRREEIREDRLKESKECEDYEKSFDKKAC